MSRILGTPGQFYGTPQSRKRKGKSTENGAANGRYGNGNGDLPTTFDMPEDDDAWRRWVFATLAAMMGKVSNLEQMAAPNGSGAATGSSTRKYYTTHEAGAEMNLDPKTVEKYCREGKLLGFKANGRGRSGEWRISIEEMERWKREGLRRPKPKFPEDFEE